MNNEDGAMGVSAGSTTLMKQASMTAHDYMYRAKESIDEVFGDG